MTTLTAIRARYDAAEAFGLPAPTAADVDAVLMADATPGGLVRTAGRMYVLLRKVRDVLPGEWASAVDRVCGEAEGGGR